LRKEFIQYLQFKNSINKKGIMKNVIYIIAISCILFATNIYGQNFNKRLIMGEEQAKELLKEALKDTVIPCSYAQYTILKEKKSAIHFAESVVFEKYGKHEIKKQRPYEVYYIDNYWIIKGTLPKGDKGGTFLIIINAKDCKVVKLLHEK
jgi:hypothetical protein